MTTTELAMIWCHCEINDMKNICRTIYQRYVCKYARSRLMTQDQIFVIEQDHAQNSC